MHYATEIGKTLVKDNFKTIFKASLCKKPFVSIVLMNKESRKLN